jgi:hypothetical protein
MMRGRALFALAPATLLTVFLWPVMVGRETWFLRDLFNYHLPVKIAQATAMREGSLPLVDLHRAGGQALIGNLNNVALYPDNLLYLIAPAIWALNAHLWLHLLLAPVAMYWLARAVGLERDASWAAGFCYAISGFFLSQLNLYNLVAGTALAPALVAACLSTMRGSRPAPAGAAAGLVWGLLLLGGDPIIAALALVAALAALVFVGAWQRRRAALLACSLVSGTLLAAPQLVELARILDSSYRGGLGFELDSRLTASWDPRTVVELLIPFFFGPPDLRHWSEVVLHTMRPLYFSLFPGLVAVALALAAGRPRTRVGGWAWSMVLAGGFFALGGWNPVVFLLYRLPLAGGLRYPIKAWLLLAMGAAVLAGIGFERALVDGSRRRLLYALAAVGGVASTAWLLLVVRADAAVAALGARLAGHLPAELAAAEVARWRGELLLSMMVVGAAAALVAVAGRAPRLAGCALVCVHAGSQLVLLRPLLATDVAGLYTDPPPALEHIEPGERVVDGCSVSFACDRGRYGTYPSHDMWWLQRRGLVDLSPFAGVQYGLRYSYNTSPEGLDSVLVYAGNRALRDLDDAQALRLLAASAVDVVLLGRAVQPAARELVDLRARLPSIGGELWIYGLRHAADEVRLASGVRGGDLRAVMVEIQSPDFDPRRDVFIPGRSEGLASGGGGVAELAAETAETVEVTTRSADPAVLVFGRAWLPLYRATVDGAPVRTFTANLGQLAIALPAGSHRVSVWADRRPFHAALVAAGAGALGLAMVAWMGGTALPPRRALSGPPA